MKKLLLVFLILCGIWGICACGENAETPASVPPESTAAGSTGPNSQIIQPEENPELPSVILPTVTLPEISIPDVTIPEIPVPEEPSKPDPELS